MKATIWRDANGKHRKEVELTLDQLVADLHEVPAMPKEQSPLIKLARFGDVVTAAGSLRHDANVLEVYGLEGDYDAGRVSVDEAVRRLERHQIAAVVVTTHRHRSEAPRWRVYAPLSRPCEPERRAELVAVLNGALGGILATESFKLSQSYYIGRPHHGDYLVRATFDGADGLEVDRIDAMDALELAQWPADVQTVLPAGKPSNTMPDLVEEMLASIPSDDYDGWVRIGAALHYCDPEQGLELWDEWSQRSDKYPGRAEIESRWASFGRVSGRLAGAGTIVQLAKRHGYDGAVYSDRERKELVAELGVDLSLFNFAPSDDDLPMFVSLAELQRRPELLKPPQQIVPRIAWQGRTTGLVGGDKSGKSTLMGHAIAAVSTGGKFLGEPVQQGTVLVVAPDEAIGDTVQRLSKWEADGEHVRLLTMHPQRIIERIREEMDERPPTLLVIDSLAEWARLSDGRAPDDGDSSGWGAVIRPLVQLSRDYGCATVLLHHSRRTDGQYRGSGEIAAALDCLIEMRRGGAEDDPTTRRFSGRARWPLEDWGLVMIGEEYQRLGEAVDLPIESKILLDLRVAGPSSRNALHKRLGGRKAVFLEAVSKLLDEQQLFEKSGFLCLPGDAENVE